MLSSVEYGAFLAFSPRGTSEVSRRSQTITYRVKNDGPGPNEGESMIVAIARRLRELLETSGLSHLLDQSVTFVPVPRAAPFPDPKSLWPALRICEAFRGLEFGRDVLPCLKRVTAVRRSRFSPRGERPRPEEHMESMRVELPLHAPEKIVLVDDVVTKGATLLAAASLVKDTFPDADVRTFALIRTLGMIPEIDALIQPAVGSISDFYGEAHREP